MRIIISPAKMMNADAATLAYRDWPVFPDRAQRMLDLLRSLSVMTAAHIRF